MLLDRGRVVAVGHSRSVARQYTQLNFAAPAERESLVRAAALARDDHDAVVIVDAWAQSEAAGRTTVLEPAEASGMATRVHFVRAVDDPVFVFTITDEHQRRIMSMSTERQGVVTRHQAAGDEIDGAVGVANHLPPGRDRRSVHVSEPAGGELLAFREDIYSFVVSGTGWGNVAVDLPHGFLLTPAPAMQEAARDEP
jgi:hypothetical protein